MNKLALAVALALVPGGSNAGQTVLLVVLLAPSVHAAAYAGTANARLTKDGRIARVNAAQLCYSLGAIAGVVSISTAGSGPAAIAVGWSAGTVLAAVIAHRSARSARTAGTPP